MTEDEFHATGQGFGDLWNRIKSGLSTAGDWLRNNITNTDIYKKNIKPIVHGIVDQGINAASALAGSRAGPLGSQVVGEVGRAAANKLYDATGAGMRRRQVARKRCDSSPRHPRGGMLRGGYEPNRYGHGTSQGEVNMSARDVRKVLPASEFSPIVSPAKYPSLIQYSQAIKGSGMKGGRGRKGVGQRGVGGSFRL
jgi:hypothetical protein